MDRASLEAEIDALVGAQRDRCLWFARRDYLPRTDEERVWALTEIQRRGDRAAFVRAGGLKRCLSRFQHHHASQRTSANEYRQRAVLTKSGPALNKRCRRARLHDVDLFDTDEALAVQSGRPRALAQWGSRSGRAADPSGSSVTIGARKVKRSRGAVGPSFYRVSLLPLVLHEELGLMLHPFDLATNKVLALVGRGRAADSVGRPFSRGDATELSSAAQAGAPSCFHAGARAPG
jgi:hypothetical protein